MALSNNQEYKSAASSSFNDDIMNVELDAVTLKVTWTSPVLSGAIHLFRATSTHSHGDQETCNRNQERRTIALPYSTEILICKFMACIVQHTIEAYVETERLIGGKQEDFHNKGSSASHRKRQNWL